MEKLFIKIYYKYYCLKNRMFIKKKWNNKLKVGKTYKIYWI